MKKNLINFLCCFVPSKTYRKKIRHRLLKKSNTCKEENNERNNKILLFRENGEVILNPKIPGLQIQFLGDNNLVEIYEPCFFLGCFFQLSRNCHFVLKKITAYGLNCQTKEYSKLFIDEKTTINGCFLNLQAPYNSISIGKDCMFSTEIYLCPSDGHKIFDVEKNEVLNNKPPEVIIGNHVWLAARVCITKNVHLPNNCIVGMASVVTRSFDTENIVIAGNPAKIIKTGVNWGRESPGGGGEEY